MGDVDGVIRRIEVRSTVTACRACGLREVASQPVPFSGPAPTRLAIVGEAPSKMADAVGESFADEGGEFARSILLELGFNLSEIAWVYAVSCFADRTATAAEVAACAPNLARQLELINPSYVLALGGVSVNALRPGTLRLGEIRGMFWHSDVANKPLVLGTWHPSAVLRNGQLREQFEADIAYFGLVADQELTDDLQGLYCVKCGNPDVEYKDEIPFCSKHLPKGKR